MSDNDQIVPIERKVLLAALEQFCRTLDWTLSQEGLAKGEVLRTFCTATEAECLRCGIKVSGEELYALSQPPAPERANAKLGRLRLGYCARQGCESYDYRLFFWDHERVKWPEVLAHAESLPNGGHKPHESAVPTSFLWTTFFRRRLALRMWIVFGAALFLLMARHWYLGGSIPVVREPENFRVDPLPQETSEPSTATGMSQ